MKKDYSDISVVLDRSGSMVSIAADTVGGFNTFVEEQKKQPGQATFTLAQFDNEYEIVHDGISIKDVPPLKFVPRGGTALLDAIGKTITKTGERLEAMSEADRPANVIFVIITDGQENSSVEWSLSKVNELITQQREKYNWQFIFLAANQDAIVTAGTMGIAGGASMSFAPNSDGTRISYLNAASNVSRARAGFAACFSDNERQSQAEANEK